MIAMMDCTKTIWHQRNAEKAKTNVKLVQARFWFMHVRAAAAVFYLLGKLQVEGDMRDLQLGREQKWREKYRSKKGFNRS